MGARRPLAHRTHQALPRHRGQEDRRSSSTPRGGVCAPVREGAHPAPLPGPRHGGTADPRSRLQGNYQINWQDSSRLVGFHINIEGKSKRASCVDRNLDLLEDMTRRRFSAISLHSLATTRSPIGR